MNIILIIFDYFFGVCVVVTWSLNLPESSNLIFSNSFLSARGIPTFGLKVTVYNYIGELIELSWIIFVFCL